MVNEYKMERTFYIYNIYRSMQYLNGKYAHRHFLFFLNKKTYICGLDWLRLFLNSNNMPFICFNQIFKPFQFVC